MLVVNGESNYFLSSKLLRKKRSRRKKKSKANKAEIINLKGKLHVVGPSCEKDKNIVYCGRKNILGGWKLNQSFWANPFKVSEKESNKDVCQKYEQYIRKIPDLAFKLKSLVGKKLACWCVPKPCHCEVLKKLMKENNLID
jgi:hypothetical protein